MPAAYFLKTIFPCQQSFTTQFPVPHNILFCISTTIYFSDPFIAKHLGWVQIFSMINNTIIVAHKYFNIILLGLNS